MNNNVSIGNSGEYFVAGELERHGFTAAVPMSNTKDFDILAISRKTGKQYAIQVKSTSYKQKKWALDKKNEGIMGDNIIYFFVIIHGNEAPIYHIVNSKIVANDIRIRHEEWLKTPGLQGQKHNDTNIRQFYDKDDLYLDNWDILK